MGRKLMTKEDRINFLVWRYGTEILDDLRRLAIEENMTLDSIGKKYGFTREYARQIFANIYGFNYTSVLDNKKETRKQIIERTRLGKFNPAYKIQTYRDGLVKKGAIAENKVLDICNTLGYKVSPYHDRSIDLVINGFMVDVKSIYTLHRTSPSQVTLSANFHLSKKQMQADFMIGYIYPINKFFVVPRVAFPKGRTIYIPGERGNNKYWKYVEAWHLLQPKEEIVFSQAISASAV